VGLEAEGGVEFGVFGEAGAGGGSFQAGGLGRGGDASNPGVGSEILARVASDADAE